jgi:GTPase involved in cell partitioning and DNA repair
VLFNIFAFSNKKIIMGNIVALVGTPNVGKSTLFLFSALQHPRKMNFYLYNNSLS